MNAVSVMIMQKHHAFLAGKPKAPQSLIMMIYQISHSNLIALIMSSITILSRSPWETGLTYLAVIQL